MPGIDSDKHVAKTLFWIHASYDLSSYILNHWSGVRMGAGGGGGGKREGLNFLYLLLSAPIPFSVMHAIFLLFCSTILWNENFFPHCISPSICHLFPHIHEAFKPASHQGSILSNAPPPPTPTPTLTNRCLSWNTLYINILTWEPRRLVHTF